MTGKIGRRQASKSQEEKKNKKTKQTKQEQNKNEEKIELQTASSVDNFWSPCFDFLPPKWTS